MTYRLTPSDRALMLARATVARRLVKEGTVDGPTALSYVVWPSEGVRRAESLVTPGTIGTRAFGRAAA